MTGLPDTPGPRPRLVGRTDRGVAPPIGTVMGHSESVDSVGGFSVRWDDRIWESCLSVSDVTVVPRAEDVTTVTPLPRRRAAG